MPCVAGIGNLAWQRIGSRATVAVVSVATRVQDRHAHVLVVARRAAGCTATASASDHAAARLWKSDCFDCVPVTNSQVKCPRDWIKRSLLCFALLPPDRFLGNLQSALLEQGATHTAAIDRHQPGPDFAYEEEQCNKENT
jgi:hypothetical protein